MYPSRGLVFVCEPQLLWYAAMPQCFALQVAAIYLTPEMFAVENGLLTPTFKLKRPQVKSKYQSAVDAMYAKLDNGAAADN
jgi:hypothetical protein